MLVVLLAVSLSGCALFGGRSEKNSDKDSGTLNKLMLGAGDAVRGVTGSKRAATPAEQDSARQLYSSADQLYREALAADGNARQDKFLEAGAKYGESAKLWPDSSLEEDALFASADSYFFAEHYPKSNDGYERLIKKYPNTKHLDIVEARRFRIAQYWLDKSESDPESFWAFNFTDQERPTRDTFGNSVRVFDRIRLEDPTGKLADDATLAAGNAFFRRKSFEKADSFYEDLRRTFPSSEHQFQAHFLGLKTKLASYRGPEYDGTALDEAEKLILQMKRQFPREYEREREYLNRALAEVRYLKAQREMQLAKYYDRRGEYGAARSYYSSVTKNFSDTPLANDATKRLGEISDEPAVPAQHMEWLVNMFPEPESKKTIIQPKPVSDGTMIATKPGETPAVATKPGDAVQR